MTETFDAVLAEVRRLGILRMPDAFDRLAAAHAAEVAERDALLVELDGLKAQLEHHTAYTIVHRGALRYCNSSMRDAYSEEHHRAEAAERDARRLDALEIDVAENGPLVLHNGECTGGSGYRGLGMANTGRTLRQGIDAIATTEQAHEAR